MMLFLVEKKMFDLISPEMSQVVPLDLIAILVCDVGGGGAVDHRPEEELEKDWTRNLKKSISIYLFLLHCLEQEMFFIRNGMLMISIILIMKLLPIRGKAIQLRSKRKAVVH